MGPRQEAQHARPATFTPRPTAWATRHDPANTGKLPGTAGQDHPPGDRRRTSLKYLCSRERFCKILPPPPAPATIQHEAEFPNHCCST